MIDPSYVDQGEPDVCDLCDARAEYLTEDLDRLCGHCCQGIGAEVRRWLGDY